MNHKAKAIQRLISLSEMQAEKSQVMMGSKNIANNSIGNLKPQAYLTSQAASQQDMMIEQEKQFAMVAYQSYLKRV